MRRIYSPLFLQMREKGLQASARCLQVSFVKHPMSGLVEGEKRGVLLFAWGSGGRLEASGSCFLYNSC
jgi:hypothetical protein